MGFIITLILVGLVLIFAEILLIPGVGVAGVLGLLSIGISEELFDVVRELNSMDPEQIEAFYVFVYL